MDSTQIDVMVSLFEMKMKAVKPFEIMHDETKIIEILIQESGLAEGHEKIKDNLLFMVDNNPDIRDKIRRSYGRIVEVVAGFE